MFFNFKDFKDHYLDSDALCPNAPFVPMKLLNYEALTNVLVNRKTDDCIRDAYEKFKERMGEDYYTKFKRVQSRAEDISKILFPPYKLLFIDITCEDWLSLVDFHKGFSRDHSIHQPLTGYIVCKLLGEGKPDRALRIGGTSVLEKAAEVIMVSPGAKYLKNRLKLLNPGSKLLTIGDKRDWMNVFYQTAIITALFHDLGYPWQFIENMHKTLDDKKLLCGTLDDDDEDAEIDKYISEHRDELMFYPFYDYGREGKTSLNIDKGIFKDAFHRTHGLPGALAFSHYNEVYNDKTKKGALGEICFCQEWASLAILMHDMSKVYLKHKVAFPRLDFSVDPLSYIIALADTLEDFNRPNAKFVPTKKGCKIEYVFPSLDVTLDVDMSGNATITYSIERKSKAEQEQYKKDAERELFDKKDGYFELSSIGLKSVVLQCK